MTRNETVQLKVLGPLHIERGGEPISIDGDEPRAILQMLALCSDSVVSPDVLVEILWGDNVAGNVDEALRKHIATLCRALGAGVVLADGRGWVLAGCDVDAARFTLLVEMGRRAAAVGELDDAVAHFDAACTLWRGIPELPDSRRGRLEMTRWSSRHAALIDDRDQALQEIGSSNT